jgi:hypothetical protein
LLEPSKAEVVNERTYALLAWYILCGDVEGARDILSDKALAAWRLSRAPAKRRAVVEAAAIRQFRKPVRELGRIDAESLEQIRATLSAAGVYDDDRPLAVTINNVFSLRDSASAKAASPRLAHNVDDEFLLPRNLWLEQAPLRVGASPIRSDDYSASSVLFCDETLEAWQVQACTTVPHAAWFPVGGPENLRSGVRIVEADSDRVHGVIRRVDVKDAGTLEISGFAKPAGRSVLGLWIGEPGNGVILDLENALVARANPSAKFPILDAVVEKSAGEWGLWRRFQISVFASEPGPMLLQVNLRNAVAGYTRYRGDGYKGIDVWGVYALARKQAALA